MSGGALSTPIIPLSPISVHGNATYMEFEFEFLTVPMLLMVLPVFYMPVTLIVILRILVKLLYAVKERNANVPLFTAISMSQFMCLLFFICDFFLLRIPATGMVTSWCARVEPNGYLTFLYTLTYYVNYSTMLFPFLVSSMRLILIVFPQNHGVKNRIILKYAIPIIAIYPTLFTFFMVPAVGYCSQGREPFIFGGVLIGFTGSLFGLRHNYFLLFNTTFWMFLTLVNNVILVVMLIKVKMTLSAHQKSHHSHKAEVALTFTTFSMVFSYLSNGMIVICAQVFPALTYYAITLRPFGNDLDTCVVAWVFYLTHPVFRRRPSIVVAQNLNACKPP